MNKKSNRNKKNMKTLALPDIQFSLEHIVKKCEENPDFQTQAELESLFTYCQMGAESDSQKFLATLFMDALNKKYFEESLDENLYLQTFEVSQIRLFDILIDKFPFVKISQQMVNHSIADACGDAKEVTLVDIGIGLGTQMAHVLELLRDNQQLKRLVVLGIEPAGDALMAAEHAVLAYRDKVPFKIEFIGIQDFAENVDFTPVGCLTDHIIVNASLALHHIQTDLMRSEVIRRIKSINPAAFILTEPNVDHFEPNVLKRFVNSYNHFYAIFQVIDGLEITGAEKQALKLFFGREIQDIFGKREADRFEKHEPGEKWISRLSSAGFTMSPENLPVLITVDSGVKIAVKDAGMVGFSFGTETVLSLIHCH